MAIALAADEGEPDASDCSLERIHWMMSERVSAFRPVHRHDTGAALCGGMARTMGEDMVVGCQLGVVADQELIQRSSDSMTSTLRNGTTTDIASVSYSAPTVV